MKKPAANHRGQADEQIPVLLFPFFAVFPLHRSFPLHVPSFKRKNPDSSPMPETYGVAVGFRETAFGSPILIFNTFPDRLERRPGFPGLPAFCSLRFR
jgi:hypothetical protein